MVIPFPRFKPECWPRFCWPRFCWPRFCWPNVWHSLGAIGPGFDQVPRAVGWGRSPGWRWGWVVGLGVVALGLTQCQPAPSIDPGDTLAVYGQRVISGDTVEVLPLVGDQPQIQQVRLIGVEVPEWEQEPWGDAAQRWLRGAVEGQTLTLEWDVQRDEAGDDRQWAYVWRGSTLINGAIVTAGHGLAQPQFPNLRHRLILQRSQETARLRAVGLWDPDYHLRETPTEFRQRQQRQSP